MSDVNYTSLVAGLVKPLVTHPESVICNVLKNSDEASIISLEVIVHQDDLGRVIGKKGRVAGAIRTIIYAVAKRKNEKIEIDFKSNEE